MKEPLFSSRYCIDRAEQRLTELKGTVNAFIKSRPCKSVSERDPHTREHVLKIKLVKSMPIEIPGIVFDMLNNLRAALDHAGFAAAIANGTTGDNAHFPFGDSLNEILGRRKKGKGTSIDIPDEIFQVMLASKPYRGGNDHLWALNKLCNSNKHEIIVPFAMGGIMAAYTISRGSAPTLSPQKWDREKQEREIARSNATSKFRGHRQVQAYVVFDEFNAAGDIISFNSILPILGQMLEEVSTVVFDVQIEASRIGLRV